ncbi:ankyrin repeat-containing domain protein [Hypoxylon sp. FL0890]|nr:ankyrin repeat-containing domain protein [Hypoxylon sp. FL0890]
MAAFLNNHSLVDLLLSRGVDMNVVSYYYGTALQAVARRGHKDMIGKLIGAGTDVNILQGRWLNPLRAAIVGCHEQIVHLLLSRGADVHSKPRVKQLWERRTYERNSTMTPLQLAMDTHNAAIVKGLLAAGQGSFDIVQQLLDAKIPANIEGGMKYRHLFDHLGNPTIRWSFEEPENENSLHAAAANGDTRTIKLLLKHGADIGKVVERHGMVLTVAARNGHVDAVRILLAAGADINVSSLIKETAADSMEPVSNAYNEVLSVLTRAEVKTWQASDALLVACTWRQLVVLELLLESL